MADTYHFTPEQTARLPVRFVERAPMIREAKQRAAELKAKTAQGPRSRL